MSSLEGKLDRVISLIEDRELSSYQSSCRGTSKKMLQELVINTILASVVGYFMFRILDVHFRPISN